MSRFFVFAFLCLLWNVSGGPCRMSPLATFLTDDQQKTLHNIIVLARNAGVSEDMVKESMDEYLAEILSPEKLVELKAAHDEFERQRRGKREASEFEKPEPKKVFDIIDQFTSDYQKFYEEPIVNRKRNF
ncbi:unnamed protein product [Caenorhabditis bovis]|uniref:SXP/RAL-2 family protein Ani s 5-like cation-binding domain-containing protein n=1 Tax=Caenorhabditis bovis TaxID=2654633 RepID=A0A8S1EGK7_9PELO|nr:unnamed protein product [Caenorhabditis bovis]